MKVSRFKRFRQRMRFEWEQIKGEWRKAKEPETIIGHSTLSAKITVGPETAARLGVPVGTVVDVGVISEGDFTVTPKGSQDG